MAHLLRNSPGGMSFWALLSCLLSFVSLVQATSDLTKLPSFNSSKPRVFILTDILNEPDDSMSLVRYLLYSNEFDTRGIIATTSTHLPNTTHPEAIIKIINAYGEVVDNLNNHVNPDSPYQSAEELRKLVARGAQIYGSPALKLNVSEGAKRLVENLEDSPDPLHVSVWGGANTLAQALLHIERTKTAAEAEELRSRLRVYAISDQDNTGWIIRTRWPDVIYLVDPSPPGNYGNAAWSGILSDDNGANDQTKVLNPWLDTHIRYGPLGRQYPQIKFGMEGDTPSYLWLLQNGLSVPEHPEWGGWGGRYAELISDPEYRIHSSLPDSFVTRNGTAYSRNKVTVSRWRDAMQDDFASRMQWTIEPDFGRVAHPPVVSINGSVATNDAAHLVNVTLGANETVVLDATGTHDSDGFGKLDFEWYVYYEPSFDRYAVGQTPFFDIRALTGDGPTLDRNDAGFANVTVGPVVSITNRIPDDQGVDGDLDWHVILQVTNRKGKHPVRRYQRVLIHAV